MTEQTAPPIVVHETNVPGAQITMGQRAIVSRLSKVLGGKVLITDSRNRNRVDTVVSAGYNQHGMPFVDIEQADGTLRSLHLEDFAEWYPEGVIIRDWRG